MTGAENRDINPAMSVNLGNGVTGLAVEMTNPVVETMGKGVEETGREVARGGPNGTKIDHLDGAVGGRGGQPREAGSSQNREERSGDS